MIKLTLPIYSGKKPKPGFYAKRSLDHKNQEIARDKAGHGAYKGRPQLGLKT